VLWSYYTPMTTRRSFLSSAGILSAGAAAVSASTGATGAASREAVVKYQGPHEMPAKMTLLSIRNSDGTETLGIKDEDGVIDVRKAADLLHTASPLTLDELLQEGNASGLKRLAAAVRSSSHAKSLSVAESSITHGRLFARPRKIICIGLNYRAHAAETQATPPRVPILFNKYNNALAAHNCTIKLPPREISYKFDYETELLIVIGKQARNVTAIDALNYVAGYCTGQDFSARDLQSELPGGQWMVGKTLDNFGPIGPYFVSADVVGDASNLKIETYVNGEVRQSSNTGDMIFGPRELVAYISTLWALEPGDIIFSGTPAGVITGMPKEKQVWLKAGDQITSSIEKLGDLKFTLA
jgi:2-keto-4-pentenoate hydratase/2-oxohepta-3-ene-1,7-dioic acid hydratase in catechol pathway